MPRKAKVVPLRRHYSKDLKRRVIYQAYTLEKTSTEIAIDLDMPLHVVQRIKQTWNEIGEVSRERRYLGRAPMMSPQHCKVCTYDLTCYSLTTSFVRSLCLLSLTIHPIFIWMKFKSSSTFSMI
jgi:transposase